MSHPPRNDANASMRARPTLPPGAAPIAAAAAFAIVAGSPALALAGDTGHHDPTVPGLLGLAVVLLAAKLGGSVARRLGQAEVLGELVAGAIVGNLGLSGWTGAEWMATDGTLDTLARLGVIVLLFQVGLESTVGEMLRVGWSALLVAVAGVVAPFGLGWAVGAWLAPDAGPYAHAFLGATLTATSIGITARVLQDLGASKSASARTILGAAVVDDVLGLLILAVVTAVVRGADSGHALSVESLAGTLARSLAFLVAAIALGVWASPRLFRLASKLEARGVLLAVALAICFGLAWAADAMGLASIVGAFAAGLVLEDVHFRRFEERGEATLEHLLAPISSFLVPVFFVVMGMRTDLRAFADPGVLALAAVLTIAAVVGKQACALGVVGPGIDRLTVGLGMIPRGEVGLIFATIGTELRIAGEPLLSRGMFSAIVVMVIVTTMITPPLLAWRLRAGRRAPAANDPTVEG